MKALPLWQPYASLVAIGAKQIETRHWRAPQSLIGQRVAIHATKGVGPGGESELRRTCAEPHFAQALDRAGLLIEKLPRGEIVATVVLRDCVAMTQDRIDRLARRSPAEHAFGHYEVGRWAWILEHPIRTHAIAFRGSQGIFDVPNELLGFAAPTTQAQGTLL